jgi:hypothetical protein
MLMTRVILLWLMIVIALAGCARTVVLQHPATKQVVHCNENMADGVVGTLSKCVDAYEKAGFQKIGDSD